MISSLSYSLKNKLLIILVTVLIGLSWFLALGKTIDAIVLHYQLTRKIAGQTNLSYNPGMIKRKAFQLNTVFHRFQVDSADWENEFWLKTSRLAAGKGIRVIYNSLGRISSDTSEVILKKSIEFRASFRDLVLLLDSIEATRNIGNINSLRMAKSEKNDKDDGISLQLRFSAINKKNEKNF